MTTKTPHGVPYALNNLTVEAHYRTRFLDAIEMMTQALGQLEDTLIDCSPMDADSFIIQRQIDALDRAMTFARNTQEKRMKEITIEQTLLKAAIGLE